MHPLCLFCAAGVLTCILLYYHAYAPRPITTTGAIPFNHHTHTDPAKTGMQCLHCHPGAETAASAGLPHPSTCLDCHLHILPADPRLLPLHAASNPNSPIYNAQPLPWPRRTPLPHHVHFNHARHTSALSSSHSASQTCILCHPNPDSSSPHTMSSCLTCHRSLTPPLPTNCEKCHY